MPRTRLRAVSAHLERDVRALLLELASSAEEPCRVCETGQCQGCHLDHDRPGMRRADAPRATRARGLKFMKFVYGRNERVMTLRLVLTTAVASGQVEISTVCSRDEVKNGGVGSGGLGNHGPASRSGLKDVRVDQGHRCCS
jgi:hypothetical protein